MRQKVYHARCEHGPRAVPQGLREPGGWLLFWLRFVWLLCFIHECLPPTSRWVAHHRPASEGEASRPHRVPALGSDRRISRSLPLLQVHRPGLPGATAETWDAARLLVGVVCSTRPCACSFLREPGGARAPALQCPYLLHPVSPCSSRRKPITPKKATMKAVTPAKATCPHKPEARLPYWKSV